MPRQLRTIIDKLPLLDELFSSERIRLCRGHLFDVEAVPKSREFDFDRIDGMLLGLAIGDALGNTSESQTPADRFRRHGEIRDYLFHPYGGDQRGHPSDDTQLAFWTLEHLIEHEGLAPEALAERFARERIYGIGSTMREFLRLHTAGVAWRVLKLGRARPATLRSCALRRCWCPT